MKAKVSAKVVDGKIIVNESLVEQMITVKAIKNVNLCINNVACEKNKEYQMKSTDTLTYTCENTEADRIVDIVISDDKMKAYMSVTYIPGIKYKLKDTELSSILIISTEVVSKKYPEFFTVEELKERLKEKGISYGIKYDELQTAIKGTESEILIAEGKEPVNDTPSEVKLFFTPTQVKFPDPDSSEVIDYKNLFRISNVSAGEKIAEIIPEITGEDGMNIFEEKVIREYVRSMPIGVTNGCKIEGNDIISLIDGKAHLENRKITVNRVYALESVDVNTGNIKFNGDIEIYDTVQDNMIVSSGGTLDVSKNVNTSKVTSAGEITILGNAINSKILSGHVDIKNKEYLDVLNEFMDVISKMIQHLNELDSRKLILKNNDLIRTLTDQKFKNFKKIALNIVCKNILNKTKRSKLVDYIKENVLGNNIFNIKTIEDLVRLSKILENEIEYYDYNSITPLDIRVGYCQDCEIKSTGNIIVGGKGQYTCKLTAMKGIHFTRLDAVARGGILSAGENINAGIVGSKAFVSTTLMVPKHGKITASLVYGNTTFCFGKAKLTLEETLKNINVHYNERTRSIEIL